MNHILRIYDFLKQSQQKGLFLNQKQYHSGQKISLLQKDTKSSLVNEWFEFSLYGLMIIVPNFLENIVHDKTFKSIYSN